MFLLQPGFASRLERYIQDGGAALATYFTGYVNENTLCFLGGFPGDGLLELFGVESLEIDTLYPTQANAVELGGSVYAVRDYAESIRTFEGTEVLAVYREDFLAGTPALTRRKHGKGAAFYLAARLEGAGSAAALKLAAEAAGITAVPPPARTEYHERVKGPDRFGFCLNWKDEPAFFRLPAPGTDLLSGKRVTDSVELPARASAVIQYERDSEK